MRMVEFDGGMVSPRLAAIFEKVGCKTWADVAERGLAAALLQNQERAWRQASDIIATYPWISIDRFYQEKEEAFRRRLVAQEPSPTFDGLPVSPGLSKMLIISRCQTWQEVAHHPLWYWYRYPLTMGNRYIREINAALAQHGLTMAKLARFFDGVRVSVRLYHALENSECTTWEEVAARPLHEWRRAMNVGRVTIQEITQILTDKGLVGHKLEAANCEADRLPREQRIARVVQALVANGTPLATDAAPQDGELFMASGGVLYRLRDSDRDDLLACKASVTM